MNDGLERLDDDPRLLELLVRLAKAGTASGVDEDFEIDAFVEETRAGSPQEP